jgi:hypothetical protein
VAVLGGAAVLLAAFLALAVALSRNPLSLGVLLAVGIGMLGVLLLALARYHAAVALGSSPLLQTSSSGW